MIDHDAVRELLELAAEEHSKLSSERPIPFLDAWERLFLAWAFSVAGQPDRAAGLLDVAERFFQEKRLAPALSLAAWVKAAPTVAVAAAAVPSGVRPGSSVAVARFTTDVGSGVIVVVGKIDAWKVAVNALLIKLLAA